MDTIKSEKLQFKISSALKNIIGKELITDDFIAVFELVKNAYDAHASKVEIIFENIYSSNSVIKIIDNGKGMDFNDLVDKWLFIAYSAKSDGTEDISYRGKINIKRAFAGAKGIGRFSCDKLGRHLRLLTTKNEENAQTEILLTDWDLFEQDSKSEFIDIGVEHYSLSTNPYNLKHGTVLEISNLRFDNPWNRKKLLKLKDSLGKLINPNQETENSEFEITIKVDEELVNDYKYENPKDKVNGKVQNFVFDVLNIKTTQISSVISLNGEEIETTLTDNGTLIYKIVEKNTFDLQNIEVHLYYMNRAAKLNFTKQMGVSSRDYGSVFLYKNGFRIYPFGEPNEDTLGIDKRQIYKLGDRVGTNDLIGRIEILGDNPNFKESTSRDGGLIKNRYYDFLIDFFFAIVIERLENYRKKVLRFGVDVEDLSLNNDSIINIIQEIANLKNSKNVTEIKYGSDLVNKINDLQIHSNSSKYLINKLQNAVEKIGDSKLINDFKRIEKQINITIEENNAISEELLNKVDELRGKENEIRERIEESLFLKSINSKDFEEIVALMHHVGIFSDTIQNYIQGINTRIELGIEISDSELKKIIGKISEENQKIKSITRFATKTNFKINADTNHLDLIQFIQQYVNNISKEYLIGTIDVSVKNIGNLKFNVTCKPLEIIILIENLIDNAKKAKASEISLTLNASDSILTIEFLDNGQGIAENKINRIFDYGYTTSQGSGLGLYHVKEIIDRHNGSISVQSEINKWTKITITLKSI